MDVRIPISKWNVHVLQGKILRIPLMVRLDENTACGLRGNRFQFPAPELAEVYACDDAQVRFLQDFLSAGDKVMNADPFDISPSVSADGRYVKEKMEPVLEESAV